MVVLLKMDEFQGRLDTPGALVRKGNKSESSALPPLPAPEIKAALRKTVKKGDPDVDPGRPRIRPDVQQDDRYVPADHTRRRVGSTDARHACAQVALTVPRETITSPNA